MPAIDERMLQEEFLKNGPETARNYLANDYLQRPGLTDLELVQAAFDKLPQQGPIKEPADKVAVTSIGFLIAEFPDGRYKQLYMEKWKHTQERVE